MQQWLPTVTRPGAPPSYVAEPPAFDASTLSAAVGGRLVRDGHRMIRGGAVDSRRVEAGNVFFALPGEHTDGHLYLADAASRGAAALVLTQVPAELPAGPTDGLPPETPGASDDYSGWAGTPPPAWP